MNERATFSGQVRRFGFSGPIYEIVSDRLDEGKFVRIRLIETGEEVDYPADAALQDPLES